MHGSRKAVWRRTAVAMTALGLGAALVAGCSSSSNNNGKTDTGKNPKLTGTPLTVGYVNSDTGALPLPEITRGANAAVKYVNDQGGINGHELKLDSCSTDGTPASSVKCANKFVADKVPLVVNGDDLGVGAALPILDKAGITVVGEWSTDTVQDPKAVVFSVSSAGQIGAMMLALKQAGVQRLVMMMPDVPALTRTLVQLATPLAAQSGMKATATTTAAVNPDFTAAFTAAKSAHADGVVIFYGENDCTNAVRTAKSVGYSGVVFAGACNQFVSTLGAQAAGVYSSSILYPANALASIADANAKAQVETYQKVMKAAGLEKDINSVAASGFSVVMTFAEIAKSVTGGFTAQALGAAASTFKGAYYMGDQVDCAHRPAPGPNCGSSIAILKVNSDGTQEVVGGKFINPSQG